MGIDNVHLNRGMVPVVIASGETVSTSGTLYGNTLCAIATPAALTGVTLTFQASADNTTFYPIYDSFGVELSITVSTSQWIVVDPADFASTAFVKVVSSGAEGADRTIQLVVRPV